MPPSLAVLHWLCCFDLLQLLPYIGVMPGPVPGPVMPGLAAGAVPPPVIVPSKCSLAVLHWLCCFDLLQLTIHRCRLLAALWLAGWLAGWLAMDDDMRHRKCSHR